MLIFKV